MGKGIRRATALAVAVVLVGGCMGTTEDRINKAVPVSNEVALSKAAFDKAAEAMPDDARQLEAEYQSQLKIRAIECSQGYVPSMFASIDTIKEEIGNAACFAAADTRLLRWIGLRRAAWLAAMPPLRLIPAKPPAMLPAQDRILTTSFADAAGIAVLKSRDRYEVMDLNTGSALRAGVQSGYGAPVLSPNGRLLAISDPEGEVRLHDTETGEMLGTQSDVLGGRVFWVGDKGVLHARSRSEALVYLDLTTGKETAVPMSARMLSAVVPTPGKPDTFTLLGGDRAGILQLVAEGSGWTPRLLREARVKRAYGIDGPVAVVGNHLFYASGDVLTQLQLDTLQTVDTSFAPMQLLRVMATRNPGQLLLQGRLGRTYAGEGMFLYSLAGKTLAKVNTAALLSSRLSYVPALRSHMGMDGSKMIAVGTLPAAPPVALSSMLASLALEAEAARLEIEAKSRQLVALLGGAGNDVAGAYAGQSYATADALAAARRPSPSFGAGEAGLVEAVRAGVLRPGSSSDVASWRRVHENRTGKSLGSGFDDRMRSQKVYVITRDMVIPSGLNGAHSVVFVLDRGVPFPRGSPGHSMILDVASGSCTGAVCGMFTQ